MSIYYDHWSNAHIWAYVCILFNLSPAGTQNIEMLGKDAGQNAEQQ